MTNTQRIAKALYHAKLEPATSARILAAMHRAALSDRYQRQIERAIIDNGLSSYVTVRNGCIVPAERS